MSVIDDGKKASSILLNETRKIHNKCIVCGDKNPDGLKLKFSLQKDESVTAKFDCPVSMQGYEGYIQGGITACLLDGAMANCLFARGVIGFTAELNIKYKFPIKCEHPATVTAKITKAYPPLYFISAQIVQNDKVVVTSEAKFMETTLT